MIENPDIPVNDGKGLLDNLGLIDSLIEDCNELLKDLIDGRNIRFCSRLVGMVQKLANLKQGVKNDTEGLRSQVADLRRLINEMTGDDADVEH